MPIEDVEYLKKNSIKQSYMFLVDSSDRARSSYPTPSEYTVEFSTPFQKVVGLEVIDASIPRTMYTIDTINQSLYFYIHSTNVNPTSLANCTLKHIKIPEGDYTIQTLIPVLNALTFMNVDNDSSKPISYITAETTTNPPDIQNTIRFRCPYPFFLAMNQSTIAESLGFDTFTQLNESTVSPLERRYHAPFQSQISGLSIKESNESLLTKMYHSVDLEPPEYMGAKRTIFEGPRGVLRKLTFNSLSTRFAQRFTVPTDGYLTQIFLAITNSSPSDVIPIDPVYWEIYPSNISNQPNITFGPITSGTVAISFIDGTLSDSSIVSALLQGGSDYWLVLHVQNSTNGIGLYYNDVLTQSTTLLRSIDNGISWTAAADQQGIYFQLSANIIMQDRYHVLTSPGIYSLIGPRYIILRCPEIEENSFRSLAYGKHHLGLAKFRLGVVGYSENRMDFSKVPLREFHPIGKLTKMTLRFELSTGELYNFRGVNHTITFAIHYYEPRQKEETSVPNYMNPNYNANFLEYMYKQEEQEEDSDDQEEDFSRDRMMDYRQRELMYLPENVRRRDLQTLMDGAGQGPFADVDLNSDSEEDYE